MTEDKPEKHKFLCSARKCQHCVDGALERIETKQTGLEPIQVFECQCGARLELSSPGYIGLQFWAWWMVSAFIIWLFLIDDAYTSTITYILVIGFVAIGAYCNFNNIWKLYKHPLIKNLNQASSTEEFTPTFLVRILNLGFFKTPLVFLIGIFLILGAAALIGYIKDYVL